jgi:hypothetical protein
MNRRNILKALGIGAVAGSSGYAWKPTQQSLALCR